MLIILGLYLVALWAIFLKFKLVRRVWGSCAVNHDWPGCCARSRCLPHKSEKYLTASDVRCCRIALYLTSQPG